MEYSENQQGARPTKYWATNTNGEGLIGELNSRKDGFTDFLMRSQYYERIKRSWEYYHNVYFDDVGFSETEIRLGGDDGDFHLVTANHLRALLDLIATYVIQGRPAWDAQAVNDDHQALESTKAANRLLDHVEHNEGLAECFDDALKYALVMTRGYIFVRWDDSKGFEIAGDPETGQVINAGDVCISAHSIFDEFHDFTVREWSKNRWSCVRVPENKWDLIARYAQGNRDKKAKIIEAAVPQELDTGSFSLDSIALRSEHTDMVDTWHFVHVPCPAMPKGRHFVYCGKDCVLEDTEAQTPNLPVHALSPSKYLMTGFGYSPSFDLQGLQEALNMELSTILTNHNNLGPTKLWMQSEDTINIADLEPGISVIQSNQEPKVLQLAGNQDQFNKGVELFNQQLQYVSGVNSVSRGHAEANLRSGKALAVIEAKTQQSQSSLVTNFQSFMSACGTTIIELFKRNAEHPRPITIIGKNRVRQTRLFQADDIAGVGLVLVKAGNPFLHTLAGKKEMAELYLQYGLIRAPEELQTVLETGVLESATRINDAQLAIVHEENEVMLAGQPPTPVSIHDNGMLHIREHAALLDSIAVRSNPAVLEIVNAHIREHFMVLITPDADGRLTGLEMQAVQGYAMPPYLQGLLDATGGVVPQAPAEAGGNPQFGPPQEKPEPPTQQDKDAEMRIRDAELQTQGVPA